MYNECNIYDIRVCIMNVICNVTKIDRSIDRWIDRLIDK